MENVLVNNKVNFGAGFVKTQKEIDFTDFTSFLVYTSVECEEDMGFLKASEMYEANFDNCKYSINGENDVWDRLEELTNRSYNEMSKLFKSCRWEDNENTAIISFVDDDAEYAILRM